MSGFLMYPDNLVFTLSVFCRLYLVGNLDFIAHFRNIFVDANNWALDNGGGIAP